MVLTLWIAHFFITMSYLLIKETKQTIAHFLKEQNATRYLVRVNFFQFDKFALCHIFTSNSPFLLPMLIEHNITGIIL